MAMDNLISKLTIDALTNEYSGSLLKAGKDVLIASGDSFFGIASIADTICKIPSQYRENEFVRKLLRFLYDVDSINSEERKKVLDIISKKSDDYVGNILLNLIDRIDHIEKAGIIANLFMAISEEKIDGEMFLRLSTILCNVPFVDLKHLSEYQIDNYEPYISESLYSSALLYQSIIDAGDSKSIGCNKYHISHLGYQLALHGMRIDISDINLTSKTKDVRGITWSTID